MMKLRLFKYKIEPYSQELIDKFKSDENMLQHARCSDKSSGCFFIDRKSEQMIGYIGFEGEMIVAFEVSKKYRRHGYGTKLLQYAVRHGAKKLSVNKRNLDAIELYRNLGWVPYDKDKKMLYMEHE